MRKDNLWKKRIVHDVISGADPNADPYHAESGRRHWSGDIRKATTPVVNSTKCARKRSLGPAEKVV